jgi:teichoic acid transport system ATP-binding protein
MRARLGFSFASALQPDILILDEVLSVGDRYFSQKSLRRTQEIMTREHSTILFVTHSLGAAEEFCQRGIVIEKGHAIFDGPVAEAVETYRKRQ